MATAPVQPAVLDYAPSPASDPAARRIRALTVIMACMIVGGLAGWILDPREFQATGYVHVATDSTSPTQPLSISTVNKQQAAVAAGMTAPAALNAAVTALAPTVPPNLAPSTADLAARLNVRPMPNSRLIAVTFTDDDPRTAAAVVNAVMRSNRAPDVQIVAAATLPAQPQRGLFYPIAGCAVGLLAGLFIVARRWK